MKKPDIRPSQLTNKSMKLHHIGYACDDISATLPLMKEAHKIKKISPITYDPIQNASLCFLSVVDGPDIELVSGGPVKQLVKNGTCLYHLCYEVADLQQALKRLKKEGATQVNRVCPAKLFNDRNIVFVQTKTGLIELLEAKVKAKKENQKQTVFLAGTFTTDNIRECLSTLCLTYDFPYAFRSIGYKDTHLNLINQNSELNKNKLNIIFIRVQDFERDNAIDNERLTSFVNDLKDSATHSQENYIVLICPSQQKSPYNKNEASIIKKLSNHPNMLIINATKLSKQHKLLNIYNQYTDKEAKIPYTQEFDTLASAQILKKIYGIYHNNYKVIAVDCDNTLWPGVCAETPIKDLKLKKENLLLQKKLISLWKKGFLICLFSKNSEQDVRRVFKEHAGMLLSEEHITAWKINWLEKQDNLTSLSQTLNLPLSSFIFIDDNPIECNQIETLLPNVLTIRFTKNYKTLQAILENTWAFEKPSITNQPHKRTKWYTSHLKREKLKSNIKTLSKFLKNLDLKIKITKATNSDIERISELSYRVTQFNFSNKKYSKKEIKQLLDKGTLIIKVALKDKYGDYGLVGAAIAESNSNELFIHTFLLSCRALSRGVEYEMTKYLANIAKSKNHKEINFSFKASHRNTPAEEFLSSIKGGRWKNETDPRNYIISTNKVEKLAFDPDKRTSIEVERIDKGKENHTWKLSNDQLKKLLKITTSQGPKINRTKKEPRLEKNTNADKVISPALKKIWGDILSQKNITKDADFFASGGTSLLALRLASEICEHFNIDVKLYEIFELSTFSNLKNHIAKKTKKINETNLTNLPKPFHGKNKRKIELAENQKSLWLTDKIFHSTWFYNISSTYNIRGKLNIKALESSVIDIINNNSVLSSFVKMFKGNPTLSIMKTPTYFNFKKIDATTLNKEALHKIISDIQLDPFDLTQYPLYRIRLLKIKEDEHILILVFHHLIFDGWSEGLFNKKLSNFYKNRLTNQGDKLNKTDFSYPDFIEWQKHLYKSNIAKKSLSYWENELKNLKVLNFPTCYSRSKKQNHKGSYQYFCLPRQLFGKLESLRKKHNTTLFCIFYSAFLMLLHKYTQQTDITIGFPISGRIAKEFEEVIGNFVSTLPLRSKIKPNMTINELIENAHKKIFESYENQFIPFQEIVKNTQSQRASNTNPVYQIMLAFQDAPNQRLSLHDLEIDFYRRGYDAARMDFILELNLIKSNVDGGVYFNTTLFNQEFIKNLINDYIEILTDISDAQTTQVNELIKYKGSQPHLETNTLLPNKKNETILVHKAFEKIADNFPEKIAIKFDTQELTYSELNLLSNQLAHYLLKHGVTTNDIVALHLKRSEDIALSILACFKIGATYVPLDPEYPDEYKNHIVSNCSPKLILTNTGAIRGLSDKVIDLNTLKKKLRQKKEKEVANINIKVAPSTVAYIIYTSGTTNAPKGVKIRHSSLSNLMFGLKQVYKLSLKDNGLLFHSYCFDFSVWEIWSMLTFGGSLTILKNPNTYTAKKLWSIIAKEKITILNQTPSEFENILLETDLNSIKNEIQLRLIIFGGEALYPKRLMKWFNVFNENKPDIYNMFGITETTVHATYQKIDKKSAENNISLIGKSIPGMEIQLLDENRQAVKTGKKGEIYLSGYGLSEGYINQKSLTKKAFINLNGKVWYRSGDLGKRTNNDNIEYLGRTSDYFKVKGYRINPDYIASIIENHSATYSSKVWPDKNNLSAIVVPRKESSLPVINFSELLQEQPNLQTKSCLLPNGMQILQHNKPETILQYQEIFIDKEYLKHEIMIGKNDTIVDVGANIGMFSLYFGAQIENIKVYAIEPIPELFKLLEHNLMVYGIKADCLNCGISNKNEKSDFIYYPSVSVLSGRNPNQNEVESLIMDTLENQGNLTNSQTKQLIKAKTTKTTIQCEFIPLSEVIDSHKIKKINLLKVDVERFEFEALQGIRDNQWDLIDQVVVEVHDFDDRLNMIIDLLKSHDFVINTEKPKILQKSNILVVYAKKRNLVRRKIHSDLKPLYEWSSASTLEKELRSYLRKKIPSYMIPAKIIIKNQIPINQNGKVDLKKLKTSGSDFNQFKLEDSRPPNSTSFETKSKLLACWRKVLNLDSCDPDTNFFDLGGDSFLLLKLHTQICENITNDIELIDLFSHTTINQQSGFIDSKSRNDT